MIKKFGIKELLKDPGKYITANDQRYQALDITQGITIYYRENFEFSAIIYNHDAFSLLLGRKVLHKLKVLIYWNLDKWYIKTSERTKVQILIDFNTNYSIRRIVASGFISEDQSQIEEPTTDSETTSSTKDYSDHEIFSFQRKLQIMVTW